MLLEPVDRDAGAPGAEVKEFSELLLVHFTDDLPEPFDDLVVFVVGALVFSVEAPIIYIDKWHPI